MRQPLLGPRLQLAVPIINELLRQERNHETNVKLKVIGELQQSPLYVKLLNVKLNTVIANLC